MRLPFSAPLPYTPTRRPAGRRGQCCIVSASAAATRLDVELTLEDPGEHAIDVVAGPVDEPAARDRATIGVRAERPRVLVLAPAAESASGFASGLDLQGYESEVRPASSAPWTADAWKAFDGAVLMNVPALDLHVDQRAALAAFVAEQGGGLLLLGGENAFGPGGYFQTDLETLSPLSSRVEDKGERVALVFVIDRSGSMQQAVDDQSRLDLAKTATAAALDLLPEQSFAGVIAFDTEATVILPMQRDVRAEGAEEALGRLAPGGGTAMFPALEEAARMLEGRDADAKHIVVLSDGLSQPGEFDALLRRLRAGDVTVSTVAIGAGADSVRLQEISRTGGGAFHDALDARALPSILSQEALLLSSNPIRTGAFGARWDHHDHDAEPLEAWPETLPAVQGYVRTTAKEAATVHVRVGPDDDPLMASWPHGLGRVAAFASHGVGSWTRSWWTTPDFPSWWARTLRWTMERSVPELQVALRPARGRLQVSVTLSDSDVVRGSDRLTVLHRAPGTERLERLHVSRATATRYEATLLDPGPGTHTVTARYDRADEDLGPITATAVTRYRVRSEAASQDMSTEYLAFATSGTLLASTSDVRTSSSVGVAWFSGTRPWLVAGLLAFFVAVLASRRPRPFAGP